MPQNNVFKKILSEIDFIIYFATSAYKFQNEIFLGEISNKYIKYKYVRSRELTR